LAPFLRKTKHVESKDFKTEIICVYFCFKLFSKRNVNYSKGPQHISILIYFYEKHQNIQMITLT